MKRNEYRWSEGNPRKPRPGQGQSRRKPRSSHHTPANTEFFEVPNIFIQGFRETGVGGRRRQTVRVELLGSLNTVPQPRPIGQQDHPFAFPDNPAPA